MDTTGQLTSLDCRMALYPRGSGSQAPIGHATVRAWVEYCRTGSLPFPINDPHGGMFILSGHGSRARFFGTKAIEQYGPEGELARETAAYRGARARLAAEEGLDDAERERRGQAIKAHKADHLLSVSPGSGPVVDPVDGQGYVGIRAGKNALNVNPLLQFDVDGATPDEAVELRDRLREVPFVTAAGLSVGGGGCWFFVSVNRRISDGEEDYKKSWWLAAGVLAAHHGLRVGSMGAGVKVDDAPSNPVSLRFASHDPGAWARGDANPLDLPPLDKLPSIEQVKSRLRELGMLDDAAAGRNGRAAASTGRCDTRRAARGGEDANPAPDAEKGAQGVSGVPGGASGAAGSSGAKPNVPADPAKRPAWVAEARAAGESTHKRMLSATFRDAKDASVDTSDADAVAARAAVYVPAFVESGRDEDAAQAEVERALAGAVEKAGRQPATPAERTASAPADSLPDWMMPEGGGVLDAVLPVMEHGKPINETELAALVARVSNGRLLFIEGEERVRAWTAFTPGRGWTPLSDGAVVTHLGAFNAVNHHKFGKNGELIPNEVTGGSHRTASAVARLLSRRTDICTAITDWDAVKGLIAVPGGRALDLATGAVRDAEPEDRLRLTLPAAPDDGSDATLARERGAWVDVLNRVFVHSEDREWLLNRLAAALQDAAGHDDLVALHGVGGSGKSSFLRAVVAAFGGYARSLPVDALNKRGNPGHPEWKAALAGGRLLFIEDTGPEALDEMVVKELLGSSIQARHLYMPSFTFSLNSPILTASQNRPSVKSEDSGMARRLKPVECGAAIPRGEIDRGLRAMMSTPRMSSVVLRDLVDRGRLVAGDPDLLTPPRSLEARADAVMKANPVSQFIADAGPELTSNAVEIRGHEGRVFVSKTDVWNAYRDVCAANQEKQGRKSDLFRELEDIHMWTPHRDASGVRGYLIPITGVVEVMH